MIHPATRVKYIDDSIGYGVFATEFIPKGTITWVRDSLDREISPVEFEALPQMVKETALTYSYRNSKGNYILPWDHTRYTNHSFFPNTILTPYNFEISIKDIQAGEQITNDYGTLNIIESFEPNNEGHERKIVYPNDIKRFWKQYDLAIHQSILQIESNKQPLWNILSNACRESIHKIIHHQKKPISILINFYETEKAL